MGHISTRVILALSFLALRVLVLSAQTSTATDMARMEGGSFRMGAIIGEGNSDEKPLREVRLSSFSLAKWELTVAEFRDFVQSTGYRTSAEIIGNSLVDKDGSGDWDEHAGFSWKNPGFVQTDRDPVVCVSFYDAVAYCNWRSQKEGLDPTYTINWERDFMKWPATWNSGVDPGIQCDFRANGYRLPTEAEWEYAARSRGKEYLYVWGNGMPTGNIADTSAKRQYSKWTTWEGYDDGYIYTAPVGSYRSNELGLFDMEGNVGERCWDKYGTYSASTESNPTGKASGKFRVNRGGSWYERPYNLRIFRRNQRLPYSSSSDMGFRLASSYYR